MRSIHRASSRALITTAATGAAMSIALAAGAAPASAHVHVDADDAAPGSTRVLTFRVPGESEKGALTTQFSVALPNVASARTEVMPGWTARLDRDAAAGTVRSVTWTAAPSAGISSDQFALFSVSVTLPDQPSVTLPATQTYSDGTVVRWDQPPLPDGGEPEHPAPVLNLTGAPRDGADDDHEQPAAGADGHGSRRATAHRPRRDPTTPRAGWPAARWCSPPSGSSRRSPDAAGHDPAGLAATALVGAALAVLALAGAGIASAHAIRVAADPAPDSSVGSGPARVSATFNEPLQTDFAAMTVVGPDGNLWSTGPVAGRGRRRQRRVAAAGSDGHLHRQLPGHLGRRARGQRRVVVHADGGGNRFTRPEVAASAGRVGRGAGVAVRGAGRGDRRRGRVVAVRRRA